MSLTRWTPRMLILTLLLAMWGTAAWAGPTLHVSNHTNQNLQIFIKHTIDDGKQHQWHELGWVQGNHGLSFPMKNAGPHEVKAVDRNGNIISRREFSIGDNETLRWRVNP